MPQTPPTQKGGNIPSSPLDIPQLSGNIPANPHQVAERPISVLIGFTEDGQAIYAHVLFDIPVKKGFLTSLGQQLTSMEENVTDSKKP